MRGRTTLSMILAANLALYSSSCKRDEPAQPAPEQSAPAQPEYTEPAPEQRAPVAHTPSHTAPAVYNKTVPDDHVLFLKVVPLKKSNASYVTGYIVQNTPSNIKALEHLTDTEMRLRKRLNKLEREGLDERMDKEYTQLQESLAQQQFSLPPMRRLVRSGYFEGMDHPTGAVPSDQVNKYTDMLYH